ncbi:7-cyano-7-deazaguanine synthase QueC [Pelagicoccus sp. SDUM812003]|uniref:7-cyano-7-deazaguanine synthase QueC n=1 Tax=Pelagicoccus sp. SDUM812003 TaxID=3041267 RepID=UPI00280D12BF|nr:7-cyano-7-deazaguanine synthase QueC [Pelagicoccus sp. SDUM812003]MDQ8202049.1 7-cyano-7-deazaguanine synthase QueC [Pelagicoccus sp. SDUM812003]
MSLEAKREPRSAVAVYSGGMDSTVMLYHMLDRGVAVKGALSVDYGQKHRKELQVAAEVCRSLGIEHQVADMRGIGPLFGKSSLTNSSEDVPEGHYAEEQMKSTVVPNRNMVLLSIATAWAISKQAEAVAYAAHGGDHAIYPDCREEFADALDAAIQLCDWSKVFLYRPFVSSNKAEIAALGHQLGAPLEKTWSCYKGGELHCGRCGTCVERREAFYLAGLEDPTAYSETAPRIADLVKSGWKL